MRMMPKNYMNDFGQGKFGHDSGMPLGGPFIPRNTSIPTNITNYSEDEIVRFINDRLWGAVNAKGYKNFVEDMPKYHRAYEGIFKAAPFPRWRSQLFVKFAFRCVEVLKAYLQDALFGNLPYIHIDANHPEHIPNAKNLEKLMDYEFYHTNYEHRVCSGLLNFVLKYGTAVAKPYWRFFVDYQHVSDFKRNKYGFVERNGTKGKKYLKWDDPWFDALDPRKVIPDPLATLTDEMRYVIEEYQTDLDQLRKDKDRYGYFNLERLYNEQAGYSQYGPKFDIVSRDIYPRNEWTSNWDYNRKHVYIDEYWGRLDLPGNQDDPRIYVVTLANNKHIIRLRPSSYAHGELPYQYLNIISREQNLFGIGAIAPILTDNYIMNALVNLRIDSYHYFLNPRLIVNASAQADRRSIEWTRPGEIIRLNSSGDIDKLHRQLVLQDTGMNTWRDGMDFHTRHGEETMALNPNAAGFLSRSRRSATEASMAMEGSNARYTGMVRNFKYSGLDSMLRQYGSLIQQYINTKHFPIINPSSQQEKGRIMKVRPEDIQGEMLYKLRDNTVTNKDVRTQLINNLLGVLAPIAQTLKMDMKPLVKSLLEMSPVANQINLDEVFPEPTPQALERESPELERIVAGMEGQPGMMPPGQPQGIPGEAAQMQAVSEGAPMAGGMF